MVQAGAEKAKCAAVDSVGAVSTIKHASVQPEQPKQTATEEQSKENIAEKKEDTQEKTECERLSAIKAICARLDGFSCEHVEKIKQRLNAEQPMDSLENLECTLENGRCADDVIPDHCPILAMAKCNQIYNTCTQSGCSQFTPMAACPFIDKKSYARCDYGFRLYHASPNTVKNNLEDKICGEYLDKHEQKLPKSVKSCVHAKKVPDSQTIKLTCRPLICDPGRKMTSVSQFGFGVRFMAGTSKKSNHMGLDLHGNGLIYSVANGTVSFAQQITGGGWCIRIKHTDKENNPGTDSVFYSEYMHMSYPPNVNRRYVKGETVGLKSLTGPKIKADFNSTVIYAERVSDRKGYEQFFNVVLSSEPGLQIKIALETITFFKKVLGGTFLSGAFALVFDDKKHTFDGEIAGKKTKISLHFMCVWVPYMEKYNQLGMPVKAGQVIGFQSGTGLIYPKMYGSHLHFGILSEKSEQGTKYLNPYHVLDESVPFPRDQLSKV